MPLISIVTPTFNEELNIEKLCAAVRDVMQNNTFDYEHIIIDNCSTDSTTRIVKDLITKDKKIKLIINNKNYGHLNSPIYGLFQSKGDASILLNSDFQDPPELIDQLLSKWKNGSKIVLLQKIDSDETTSLKLTRRFFYWFLKKISKTPLTVNTTGSGLFDKSILNEVKKLNDPCPYFRGLVADIGPKIDLLKFKQPVRLRGETKNNFFTLMDMAILAIVKHSKALALYTQSKALIYPSLMESFGLPLVEASGLDMPIIASELDFVRDIVSPIQSFDPSSSTSIARAVRRYLEDPEDFIQLVDGNTFIDSILAVDDLSNG